MSGQTQNDGHWMRRAVGPALVLIVLAAGCLHSQHRHVALLSYAPPGAGWRRMARRFGKKIVHVPLSHFSQETVQQLRLVHVLNGKQVRSYAAEFIRKA